jgi:serine/threonine protein kinase
MNELIGRQIDHYRIDALLGEGGMGAVYRAYDLNLARNVALKVMHHNFASQQEFRARFMQEAQSAARLNHRSIVDIHYFGMSQGSLYMVMAYIPGGSLNTHLKQLQEQGKIVQLREILIFLAQVADALGYAHREGVVHRDVKPSNVLVQPLDEPDREGEPPLRGVVTDFGLAKLLTGGLETRSDVLIGTYPYMSPEQCLHQTVDGRSDIYSLGVVLYQLVTGKLPLNIKSAIEAILVHQRHEMPPAPRVVCPALPVAIEEIINKAIAKKPEARFQTAEAVASALRGAAHNLSDEDVTQFESQGTAVSLSTHLESRIPESEPSRLGSDLPLPPSGDQLVIAQRDHTPRAISLTKMQLTIGRSNDNDIVLDHTDISRHHARLEQTPHGWQILDLGSTNGTYLEKIRLLAGVSEAFSIGKTVRIGPYFIHLRQATASLALTSTGTYSQSKSGQIGVLVEPTKVEIVPGSHTVLQVEVINQGNLVDHFRLRVTELPPAWVTLSQSEIALMPSARGTLSIDIHPPQDSSAKAGSHRCEFIVESTAQAGEIVTVPGEVIVKPFEQFAVELHPTHLSHGGTTQVTIKNEGNVEGVYSLRGRDPANEIEYTGEHARIRVPSGETVKQPVSVKARKRSLLGTAQTLAFEIHVHSSREAHQARTGQLRVTPLIPMWIVPLLGMFLMACLAVVFFRVLPNLTGPTLTEPAPIISDTDSPDVTAPALSHQEITLQWKNVEDRIIMQRDGQYWEKYQANTNVPGLYLRTDDINAFGDYLELKPDETFNLEEDGIASTGTWKVQDDLVILTFP